MSRTSENELTLSEERALRERTRRSRDRAISARRRGTRRTPDVVLDRTPHVLLAGWAATAKLA